MKNVFQKFVAIAAVYVVCITAAQAQAPAGPNRPAIVPLDYVITPFVALGNVATDQIETAYMFGTHLPKTRQIANSDTDEYTDAVRKTSPSKACYAYLVRQLL